MKIDPLQMVAQLGKGAGTAGKSLSRSGPRAFETLVDERLDRLKGSEKAEAYAVESLQRARFGLLRGLLNDQEDADDSLFFSAALDSLAIRSEALRSQMVDSYAAVQRAADSAGPASRGRIDLLIERVAEHVKLAPELIRSVVSAESDYRPQAVSPAGARGLMQLMPETAAELGVTDSFDPHQNLLGGSRYLKGLLDKYDGDLDRALAAYNWGQGNVDRHGLARMPDETRRYIARIRQSLERGAA